MLRYATTGILPYLVAPVVLLSWSLGFWPAALDGFVTPSPAPGSSGALLWWLGLFAPLAGWQWFVVLRHAGPVDEVAHRRRAGTLLFFACQWISLYLFLPLAAGDQRAWIYWLTAAVLTYLFLPVLARQKSFYLAPAIPLTIIVGFAAILDPAAFGGHGNPLLVAPSCLPGGLNLQSGCLTVEALPLAAALQVVALLLAHFGRHLPGLVALLILGAAARGAGTPLLELAPLLALSAAIVYFPGRPARPAWSWPLRGLVWGAGLYGLQVLLAGWATYSAWLAGLILMELVSAAGWFIAAFVRSRRSEYYGRQTVPS